MYIHKRTSRQLPKIRKYTDSTLSSHFHLTQEAVRKELLKLNVNKSVGPDEIHRRIFFQISRSIKQGTLPKEWKLAYISAIYKKGSRKIAESYRISLQN